MINVDLFRRNMNSMLNNDNCENVSDGYHTFAELYHHRAVLTAALFNECALSAWKSKLHADGTMDEGYFITGMETGYGQVTYHYPLKYWDMFNVVELVRAPEWDGHTPEEAIARIAAEFCDTPYAREESAG